MQISASRIELSADGVTLDISDTPLASTKTGFEESGVYLGVIAKMHHPERAAAYIQVIF